MEKVTIKTQKRFFNRAYSLGDKRVGSGYGWPIKNPTKETRKFLLKIKKKIKKGKMLDIGCGEGRNAIFFAKNGFESYGIDISKLAINRAKKFAREQNVENKTHFTEGDALDLKYKKGFFDVIVDWSCFDHILDEDWDLYLKNIMRVLRPNGYFMLSVFSINTPFLERNQKFYVNYGSYFRFFTKREIKDIFSRYFEHKRKKVRATSTI